MFNLLYAFLNIRTGLIVGVGAMSPITRVGGVESEIETLNLYSRLIILVSLCKAPQDRT